MNCTETPSSIDPHRQTIHNPIRWRIRAGKITRSLVGLCCLLIPIHGHAGLLFTDEATFLAALPGPAGVLDFDSLAGGTLLSGSTQNVSGGPGTGIIFPASIPDILSPPDTLDLIVVADSGDNPTSSGGNSLGADDPGNFNTLVAGSGFSFGLTSAVNAFGLTFITPDQMLDSDIQLHIGADIAELLVSDGQSLGIFGGSEYFAYFLGITSDIAFTSASIEYASGVDGAFLYNIDDITVATAPPSGVPAPGTPALLITAGLLFRIVRRRNLAT